jgi:hypothetical protein
VSFSCGGWLQFYLFGVARALQSKGLTPKGIKYAGCSAGSLAAYGIALNGDFDVAVEFCKKECVPVARSSLSGLFDIQRYAREACKITGCLEKVSELEHGTLQCAITKLPSLEKERVMSYTSGEDLLECLMSSCAVYPFAPLVYHRDRWNVDGGFTDFLPLVIGEGITRENTVTVSPFHCSSCDIKPSRYIPFWWGFVPPNSSETIDWIYALGYEDGISYIEKVYKNGVNGVYYKDLPTLKTPLSTKNHPYYAVPRSITMKRFLGYSIHSVLPASSHRWVELTLDAVLFILLILVWKPLIVTLIYVELFIRMVLLLARTFVSEMSALFSPFTMLVGASFMLSNFLLFFNVTTLIYTRKLLVEGPRDVKKYQDIWKYLSCMASMSLLSKYIPSRPSGCAVGIHDVLEEVCFTYRMFKFLI